MKKENIYILAGTLATTSIIGLTTFASSSLSVQNPPTAKVAMQDTDKETNDDSWKEVNDKQEVTSKDEWNAETNDDNIKLPANHISESSAQKIALAANPWQNVTWVSTEDENWTIVYNVVLDNKNEVKVDVVKGVIIKTDKSDINEWEKESTNDSDASNED